jgi:H+/Cl- antiporter ClcA
MTRYGSEQLRGHGIYEAIKPILINGSKVHTNLPILQSPSAAPSIGTRRPFGAMGPIIITGDAIGSMIGQFFRLLL